MSEITKLEFEVDKITLQTFISNTDSFRVLLDTGIQQWPEIAKIPAMSKGIYKVRIELIEEE